MTAFVGVRCSDRNIVIARVCCQTSYRTVATAHPWKPCRSERYKHCCTLLQVSRFLQLVTTSEVALTGLNFFSVTRPMLLTVCPENKCRYSTTHACARIILLTGGKMP
jgi:hypothetical protein